MKRTFLTLTLLLSFTAASFSQTETGSSINQTVSVRNGGKEAVSLFIVANYIHANGFQSELKVDLDSFAAGEESTITFPVEEVTENPVVALRITSIGSKAFTHTLTDEEAQHSSFTLIDSNLIVGDAQASE